MDANNPQEKSPQSPPQPLPPQTEVPPARPEGGVSFAPASANVEITVSAESPAAQTDAPVHNVKTDDAPAWLARKQSELASKSAPPVAAKPTAAPTPHKSAATIDEIKRAGSAILRPLRTYKDDIARTIAGGKVSTADISVAEQNRRLKELESEHKDLELKERLEKDRARLEALEREKKAAAERAARPQMETLPEEERRRSETPAEPAVKAGGPLYSAGELTKQAEVLRVAPQRRGPLPHPLTTRKTETSPEMLATRIAEQEETLKRREETRLRERPLRLEERPRFGRGMKMVFASFTLLIIGVATLGATLYLNRENPASLAPLSISSLVFAETVVSFSSAARGTTLLAELDEKTRAAQIAPGSLAQLRLEDTLEDAGELSAQEWLSRLGGSLSPALIRSLHPKFMLGFYALEGKNRPFLIFKTLFYENAFAEMLVWEKTMNRDLAPLFGPALALSASSTEASPTESPFRDRLINNKDTRVLTGESGDIALLYSFVDPQTLIVTTDRETFLELLSRLNSSRVER